MEGWIDGGHFEELCIISSMMKRCICTTIHMVMNDIIGVNSSGVNFILLINISWSHLAEHIKIFGLSCGFWNLVFSPWLAFWGLAFLYWGNYHC